MVVFTIPGKPQGKARARTTKTGHTYTPEKTVLYENLVKTCFMEMTPRQTWFNGEPLALTIYATFSIPKSKTKKEKLMMLQGYKYPTVKPDADNIAKVICDALNGVAYTDDTQIIELRVIKRYVREDTPAHVTVSIEALRSEQSGEPYK